MMGLGGALFEAIRFDDDKIRNPKLSLYRVPRFNDLPVSKLCCLTAKTCPLPEPARRRSSRSAPRSVTRSSKRRASGSRRCRWSLAV